MSAYEIEVEQHQQDFINSKAKFTLLSGGYGSGKTYAMILKCIQYALEYPGIKILFCAETFPLLRDTVYREFESLCPRKFISQKGTTKLPLNIRFKNTSEVYFRAFDKEWKPKSFTVGAIFTEELTTFKQTTFRQLRGRLRQSRPEGSDLPDFPRTLGAATNPDSLYHWVHKDFIDEKTKIKGSKTIFSKSHDNTFLTADYLNDLESYKDSNPDYYKRNVQGEWGKLEGLIYKVPPKLRQIPKGFQEDFYIAGLDFGFGHPTALSVIAVSSGRFGVVDEIYRRGMTATDIIEAVGEKHDQYNFSDIYCDSARPEIIEQMVQAGLPAVPARKGAGSVFGGIMYLKGLLGLGDLFYSPDVHYHLRELDSYVWDATNEAKEAPVKANDDCCDATRYAVHTYSLENGLDVSAADLLEFQKSL